MTEGQPRTELSLDDLASLAYANFVNLSVEFGKTPPNPDDNMKELNLKTLRVPIPADPVKRQKHLDLISGINYGGGLIEIFYVKNKKAGKVALRQDSQTKEVEMAWKQLFDVHPIRSENSYSLLQTTDGNALPDMHGVNELLSKAEKILRGEEAGYVKKGVQTAHQKELRLKQVKINAADRDLRIARDAEKKKNERRTGRRNGGR